MYGINPIRPPLKHDGSVLDVKEVFATLQGEGPFAGHPAVFVRLGGCNLACGFCDTEFEDYRAVAVETLAGDVARLAQENGARVRDLVVITGGEPLRQNIAPLCTLLLDIGFRVQVETNGTLWRELPEGVNVVCSPKSSAPLRPDLLARTSALKFLLSRTREGYISVPEVGQGAYDIPVYVQPMDEGDAAVNAENLAYALDTAQRHGYRLSLQLHKLLGIA